MNRKLIESIAKDLRTSPESVYAVIQVESNGSFTWGNGKIPILLERHWVFRLAVRKFGTQKARLLAGRYPDICNPRRGGYGRMRNQYQRLAKAIKKIDSEIAHQATSFGGFQIMGFNHSLCGYESAVEMSDAFHKSPDNQMNGFMNFLKSYKRGKCLRAMREKNWDSFAYHYNGSAYRENRYDSKLRTAAMEYQTLYQGVTVH